MKLIPEHRQPTAWFLLAILLTIVGFIAVSYTYKPNDRAFPLMVGYTAIPIILLDFSCTQTMKYYVSALSPLTRHVFRHVSTCHGPDQVLPATDHRTWSPDGAVSLRIASSGAQSVAPVSVPTLFKQGGSTLFEFSAPCLNFCIKTYFSKRILEF